MRENALLSPHRGPQRPANDHDGRITTDAPGVMWGTDAAVIPTVEDGNIALFMVVEHWNAEVLGWHVAEKADRFAAAQALDLAVHNACGTVRADAAAAFCCATTTAAPLCPITSRTRSPSSA